MLPNLAELLGFLLIIRWYVLGWKSEVCCCVSHSVNKTRDAAASSLYKCNSLFTEGIAVCAFSSAIKTSHNHDEGLQVSVFRVWVRNARNHIKTAVLSV